MPANITRWDERYLSGEHTTKEPSPLLRKAIKNLKPGRALDIACGVGRHAIHLAKHGWQVTAVDSSRAGIEILQQRAREAGVTVRTRVADLESGVSHRTRDLRSHLRLLLPSARFVSADSRGGKTGRHDRRRHSSQ